MILYNQWGDQNIISIFGSIEGGTDWGDDVLLQNALQQAGGNNIKIWLSSGGGDLNAAFAMRNMLENYIGEIEVHTFGLVASAAVLLLCAKNINSIAHQGSLFMIHQGASLTFGNKDEHIKAAEMLSLYDDQIKDILLNKINVSAKKLDQMIKSETWLSREYALEIGLINQIDNSDKGFKEPAQMQNIDINEIKNEIINSVSESLKTINVIDSVDEAFKKTSSKYMDHAVDLIDKVSKSIEAKFDDKFSKTIDDINNRLNNIADQKTIDSLVSQIGEINSKLNSISEITNKNTESIKNLDVAVSTQLAYNTDCIAYSVHDEKLQKSFKLNF
jgi:ATP-dependent Clp protease protease subunit